MGHGYSGSSAGGPERPSQLPTGSRHSSMLGTPQDAEMSAYRDHSHHPSTVPNYGGQYSSVYGSTAQQVSRSLTVYILFACQLYAIYCPRRLKNEIFP